LQQPKLASFRSCSFTSSGIGGRQLIGHNLVENPLKEMLPRHWTSIQVRTMRGMNPQNRTISSGVFASHPAGLANYRHGPPRDGVTAAVNLRSKDGPYFWSISRVRRVRDPATRKSTDAGMIARKVVFAKSYRMRRD